MAIGYILWSRILLQLFNTITPPHINIIIKLSYLIIAVATRSVLFMDGRFIGGEFVEATKLGGMLFVSIVLLEPL
jgi:hypothetical protein